MVSALRNSRRRHIGKVFSGVTSQVTSLLNGSSRSSKLMDIEDKAMLGVTSISCKNLCRALID